MNKLFLLSFFVFLQPQMITTSPHFNFVVWNVGQGLWTSFLHRGHCYHIDMGGESFPKSVLNLCQKKKNFLLLTHEDWDHVRFISRFKRQVFSLCLMPLRKVKRKFLKSIKKCKPPLPKDIKIISYGNKTGTENENSIVYLVKGQILIPGDTTKKEEIKWSYKLPQGIRFLILAHHGSNTSTSGFLLSHVDFKMAIASSRKKRYGHPHRKVVERLRAAHISLLETERMGNIYLTLP